jgi:hypothetical protein
MAPRAWTSRNEVHDVRTVDRRRCAMWTNVAVAAWLHLPSSMKHPMSRVAKVLLLSALAACAADVGSNEPDDPNDPNPNTPNPNDPNDPNDPGGSMTAAQFLDALGHKECDDAFTCKASFPADAGVTFAEAYGANAQACYADAAGYYNATAVQAAITAGKITFDGTAAAACVAGFSAPVCTTYWDQGANFPAACDTAMVGKVATGAACTVDFECAGDNWCDDTSKKCAAIPDGQ